MKYFLSLLLFYMLSGITTASRVLPLTYRPRPTSETLYRSRPVVLDNATDDTIHQRRDVEHTDLPFKDLTQFYTVGHDNTIKKFEWGQFNYLWSMSKVYVPPKYRLHKNATKDGQPKEFEIQLDRPFLEENVQAVIGMQVNASDPVSYTHRRCRRRG